jgi:hypothetical protein
MDFEGVRTLVPPMLEDYPTYAKPGWDCRFEGHLIATHPMRGQLELGVVPHKQHDQWLFHENSETTVLVVCYTRKRNWLQRLLRLRGKADKVVMHQKDKFNLVGNGLDYELPTGSVEADREIRLNIDLRRKLEQAGQLADLEALPGRRFVGHNEYFQLFGEHDGTVVLAVELTVAQAKVVDDDAYLFFMTVEEAGRTSRDARSGMALLRFATAMVR